MDQLYAPWRDMYQKTKKDASALHACPFCSKFNEDSDKKNLIIKRYKTCAVMLNINPYGIGHVMVIPYVHVASLTELTQEERHDLMDSVATIMATLEKHLSADGMNVGLNKGKVSGGSVSNHLHVHIVPRFTGDSGFLVTCGNTKILSFDLVKICDDLIRVFSQ